MAVVFFDTSALVRRYDRAEPGAAHVQALCRRRGGHTLLIASITSVEVASALNRKLREGALDRSRRDRLWMLFRVHRRDQYRVIAMEAEVFRRAERLLFGHTLRAYDALQLASALQAARLLADITSDFRFCTADQAQAEAARREGLSVEVIT